MGQQTALAMAAGVEKHAKRTRLAHSVAATAANVNDAKMLPDLLHGEETAVGDSSCAWVS